MTDALEDGPAGEARQEVVRRIDGVVRRALDVRERARQQGVAADTVVPPERRDVPRERDEPGLDDGVRGRIEIARAFVEIRTRRDDPVHRRDVDDAAAALAPHRLSEDLSRANRPVESRLERALPLLEPEALETALRGVETGPRAEV